MVRLVADGAAERTPLGDDALWTPASQGRTGTEDPLIRTEPDRKGVDGSKLEVDRYARERPHAGGDRHTPPLARPLPVSQPSAPTE